MTIPRIDPLIKTVWVSYLRALNGEKLRSLSELIIIQSNDEPVAVLLPYAMYLELQASILEPLPLIEALVSRPSPYGPILTEALNEQPTVMDIEQDAPASDPALYACWHCGAPSPRETVEDRGPCADCQAAGHTGQHDECLVCMLSQPM